MARERKEQGHQLAWYWSHHIDNAVPGTENVNYLFWKLFDKRRTSGASACYEMGMAGHNFMKVLSDKLLIITQAIKLHKKYIWCEHYSANYRVFIQADVLIIDDPFMLWHCLYRTCAPNINSFCGF